MKKLVSISLCLLFVSTTVVSGESYTVSGKVLLQNTNVTVGLANIHISCTWGPDNQCSGGGDGLSNNEPEHHGEYSIGWDDCGDISAACQSGDSCVDRKMTLRATKNIGGMLYAGGFTWDAKAASESKNIRIYPTAGTRDDIILGSDTAGFAGPGPQLEQTAVVAFDADGGDPTTVTGCDATLTYDQSKMLCINVAQAPGFSIVDANIAIPGVIKVSVAGSPVPLGDAGSPTELFKLEWDVALFETVDYTYVVTGPDPNDSWLTTVAGPNYPIVSSTEYKIGESTCKPYFRLADFNDWDEAVGEGHVYPIEPNRWDSYMQQWDDYIVDGNSYPNDVFIPSELYVYEGNESDPNMPDDGGLVMAWGSTDGNMASAWVWDYKKDPDLSNCTINLVVTAPKMGANGQVNQVSFGLQNPPMIGGPIRAWYWNCGAAGSGAPITWGVPTRLTINTALAGINAATPTASAYMSNPGFNLTNVQWILCDENGQWVSGPNPAPGPGGFQFLWNYWHWIMISPNTTLAKNYYKKWSQAAVVIDANDPPLILGWDEYSDYNDPCHILADDWKCTDDRPITDLHWWGSFIGWNDPCAPPVLPKAFHIGIWSDVPDPNPSDYNDFSHPGQLIWEHLCDNYVMNFAGYDVDPRYDDPDPCTPVEPTEACFQFNQLLSQEDWFYQEHDPCDVNGTVYWLSVSAVWDPCQPVPPFKWGWKTIAHNWNDDAVIIQTTADGMWPPAVGSMWGSGVPIQHPPYWDPDSISFDLAFVLTTNKPDPNDEPAPPDLNYDGIVNLKDVALMAGEWLQTVQW